MITAEAKAAYNRKWYRANADKCKAWSAAWTKANRARASALSLKSARRLAGMPEPTRPTPNFCECCGKPPESKGLALDHCHESGAFRGWLCWHCNTAIGKLGDNEQGLMRALNYLRGNLQCSLF
jgi:recombination endonuclease VII